MNSEQEEAPTLEFFTSKVLQEKDKDMLKGCKLIFTVPVHGDHSLNSYFTSISVI